MIHNILQLLIRESHGQFPPSSPLTPRAPGLITPTSPAFPQSPHWPLLGGAAAAQAVQQASTSEAATAQQTFPNLSHIISQTNSVTLSPAPSIDSQNGGSPKQQQQQQQVSQTENITSIHQLYPTPKGSKVQVPPPLTNGNGTSSSHSDSEDSQEQQNGQRSPKTPTLLAPPRSPKDHAPSSSSTSPSMVKEETPELNTNGRLLWDFLQQLLNDPQQRYTNYIAWKDKESGVFKIVDPAGLAKLWGIQKNHLSMNYDKMSRALRYYYRVNILRKVQGERHCYQYVFFFTLIEP